MITGAHSMIYSVDADADRAFFKDVLNIPNVDAGGGWLIFAMPPTELAFHPASMNGEHELFLLCDDINAFILEMKNTDTPCSSVKEEPWGHIVRITLPGGGCLGVYKPIRAQAHQT